MAEEAKTTNGKPFHQFFGSTEIKMTTEVNELFSAISKVQGELATVPTDADGQVGQGKYHYATLAALMPKLNPLLAKNDLTFNQFPVQGGMINLIGHTSGQWLMARFDHGVADSGSRGNPFQQMGSAISYTRRYCAMAIWCVAAEDDDAASATGQPPARQPAKTVESTESTVQQPASPIMARLQTPPPAVNFDFLRGEADTSVFWFHSIEKVPWRTGGQTRHFYKALAVTGEQFASFSDSQADIIAQSIKGKIGCTVEWVKKERQGGRIGYNLQTVLPIQSEAPIQSMTLIVKDRAQTAARTILSTDRGRFACGDGVDAGIGEEIRVIIQPTPKGRLITEILKPQETTNGQDNLPTAGGQDQELGQPSDQPQRDDQPPTEPPTGP
jgi:hypothetical protein